MITYLSLASLQPLEAETAFTKSVLFGSHVQLLSSWSKHSITLVLDAAMRIPFFVAPGKWPS
jgi:hypothetical protein